MRKALPCLMWIVLVTACSDDPEPGPSTPKTDSTGEVVADQLHEGPYLDVIRNGGSWRLSLTLPDDLPAGFEPQAAVIEAADGRELARRTWSDAPMTFNLETEGRIVGVVLGTAGQRLSRTLELP